MIRSFITIFGRSLFMKFTLAFIIVGLLPLAALGTLAMNMVSTQAEQNTIGNLRQAMHYLNRNLETSFMEYNNVTKLMYTNTTLYDRLLDELNHVGTYPSYSHSATINDFLKTVLHANRNIRSVFFVVNETGEVYAQSNNTLEFNKNNFLWRRWSRELEDNPKQIHYFMVHPENYFYSSEVEVLTFARHFIDKSTAVHDNPVVLGTLYVDVPVSLMTEQLESIKLNPNDTVDVLNAGKSVLFGNKDERRSIPWPTVEGSENEVSVVEIQFPILGTDMLLAGQFMRRDLLPALLQFRSLTGVIVTFSVIFLILLSITFSRRFTRPVREVIEYMSRAESGKLDMQVPVHSTDELGQLARGFNRLVDRLGQFIKVAYLAEIKQKRAELNALKNQIRPHYLYNTLEVIRMSAISNEDRPVAEMIHSLSQQLNYVLDYGENFVTLGEELEHIQHYFKLIRIRTENAIQLEIVQGEEVRDEWLIVKMSIQPLIENAVQHGIWPRSGRGRIRIELNARNEEFQLMVTVIDDGVGMSEERQAAIMEYLHQDGGPDNLRKHLGLKNVNDRLKSLFEGNPGIEIQSREHIGTSVQFQLPVQGKEATHADGSIG